MCEALNSNFSIAKKREREREREKDIDLIHITFIIVHC
jgi:hypothetical protein